MKNFWVSWYRYDDQKAYEYHGPWWVSGSGEDSRGEFSTICMAMRATSEEDAQEQVYAMFDERPEDGDVNFRFVEEQPDDWSPYSSRFRKADWMKWPECKA